MFLFGMCFLQTVGDGLTVSDELLVLGLVLDLTKPSNVALWSSWRPICSIKKSSANGIIVNTTRWSQN